MKQNNSILNNSYNTFDFSKDRSTNSPQIAIDPDVVNNYEESVTEDITRVYEKEKLNETMLEAFQESEWYEKYANGQKKVEKSDMSDMYYHFRGILMEKRDCSEVDAFCTIAEFFDMNYKVLYNDILTIATKIQLLNDLQETYGLSKKLGNKQNRLF